METVTNENTAVLCGTLMDKPVFSHMSHGDNYYILKTSLKRTSGAEDYINVLAKKELIERLKLRTGDSLYITGELRSFNNKSGQGNRLVITVFAKNIERSENEAQNRVILKGALCKEPILRKTPLGREICDLIIAVNRRYGRADYIPCIAWGKIAKEAAGFPVGSKIILEGRIQSRNYMKVINDKAVEKTAFEVSVSKLESDGREAFT